MVNPDLAAGPLDRDEVPIIPVIIALGGLIPLPQLVEFQVTDDDIGAVLDDESGMLDLGAVG
ncbi:hypothetical protein D3C71_2204480 [compost metagenome]